MKTPLQQGDLVGFVNKGQILVGKFLSEKGSRAVITLPGHKRNLELPIRDLTLLYSTISSTKHSLDLPTISETRECVLDQTDLREAWWLLENERQNKNNQLQQLKMTEFADFVLPEISGPNLAALWIWLNNDQPWFRLRRDHLVEARSRSDIRKITREKCKQRILNVTLRDSIELLKENRKLTDLEANQLPNEIANIINQLVLVAKENNELIKLNKQENDLLKCVGVKPSKLEIRRWLFSLGLYTHDTQPSIRGSSWSAGFPQEVIQEAFEILEKHQDIIENDKSRIDLTHLITYTIDDISTKEIDDAISLEDVDGKVWVWIHIADPARVLKLGSEIDNQAKIRATSLYLAKGTIPMMPMNISEGVFSLIAGKRCPALSVAVLLDQNGAIEETKVSRTWIRPRYRLTYDDGDELIELAPPGDESLAQISLKMKTRLKWRVGHGALNIEQAEGRFSVHSGKPELQIIQPSSARQMISEAMILMGAVIAEFGQQHQLALPYRSQETTELPGDYELSQVREVAVRNALIRRCLSRGVVGIKPRPHFSLGLSAYVQASSPIRRYADLLAHRQIIAQLEGEATMTDSELMGILDQISEPIRQAQQINREDQRHWQQVWFQIHQGKTWNALFLRWLRIQDQLALVHVDSLSMDLACRIESNQSMEPGITLTLRVELAEPLINEIRLLAI